MNRKRSRRRSTTGKATFFSRSRAALWQKGETSGHCPPVRELYADCDADTLLLAGGSDRALLPHRPAVCFFRHRRRGAGFATKSVSAAVPPRLEARDRERRKTARPPRATRRACSTPAPRESATRCAKKPDEFARAMPAKPTTRGQRSGRCRLPPTRGSRVRGVCLFATCSRRWPGGWVRAAHAEKASRASRKPESSRIIRCSARIRIKSASTARVSRSPFFAHAHQSPRLRERRHLRRRASNRARKLGCTAQVVDDGNAGLQQAASPTSRSRSCSRSSCRA